MKGTKHKAKHACVSCHKEALMFVQHGKRSAFFQTLPVSPILREQVFPLTPEYRSQDRLQRLQGAYRREHIHILPGDLSSCVDGAAAVVLLVVNNYMAAF